MVRDPAPVAGEAPRAGPDGREALIELQGATSRYRVGEATVVALDAVDLDVAAASSWSCWVPRAAGRRRSST